MILLVWFLFGLATSMVAQKKGRGGCAWFILGILLGPFGLLFAFIASDVTPAPRMGVVRNLSHRAIAWTPDDIEKRCPDCRENIKLQARVCRFCQRSFTPEEVEREVRTARDDFADSYPEAVAWKGRRCPQCGHKNGPSFPVCRGCGCNLEGVPVTYELDER